MCVKLCVMAFIGEIISAVSIWMYVIVYQVQMYVCESINTCLNIYDFKKTGGDFFFFFNQSKITIVKILQIKERRFLTSLHTEFTFTAAKTADLYSRRTPTLRRQSLQLRLEKCGSATTKFAATTREMWQRLPQLGQGAPNTDHRTRSCHTQSV